MVIFSITTIIFSVGLICLFIALPKAFLDIQGNQRSISIVSFFGFFSGIFSIGIALSPQDVNSFLHAVFATLAYIMTGFAAFFSARAARKMKLNFREFAGLVALILALLAYYNIFVLAPFVPVLFTMTVTLQKVLEYAICTWAIILAGTGLKALKNSVNDARIDKDNHVLTSTIPSPSL